MGCSPVRRDQFFWQSRWIFFYSLLFFLSRDYGVPIEQDTKNIHFQFKQKEKEWLIK